MASRVTGYNLRAWPDAGVAEQANTQVPVVLTRDLSPCILNLLRDTDSAMALYSNVVASRPPSPRKETRKDALMAQNAENKHIESGMSIESSAEPNNISSSEEGQPEFDDESLWTTVKRRRAQSHSPLKKTQIFTKRNRDNQGKLTLEQVQAVNIATTRMTKQQKEMLLCRQNKIPVKQDSSASSRGEGLSRPKGKGIDPKEWGNLNINQDSLDIEAQAAALESIMHQKKREEKISRRIPHPQLPVEFCPAAQIAANSYLGNALKNIGHTSNRTHLREDESPSSDLSSGSEDDTSSDESSGLGAQSTANHRWKHNWHRRNLRRRKKSSSSTGSGTLIKPIAPKEYDGQADACSYHRFIRESEAYLWDGKVKGRRQIFLLSYYLTGKAYDFYTQKVASNEGYWTLRQFYDELFNYCFPVDYRTQLQKNLARCHQNEKKYSGIYSRIAWAIQYDWGHIRMRSRPKILEWFLPDYTKRTLEGQPQPWNIVLGKGGSSGRSYWNFWKCCWKVQPSSQLFCARGLGSSA